MKMPLEIYTRDRSVLYSIYAKQSTVIPPYLETWIPVHYTSLSNYNYFFESDQGPLSLYTLLVDTFLNYILAKNDFNYIV